MVVSQYSPVTGPTRNHYHYEQNQQAPSGKKHAVPFYQSASQSNYLHTTHVLPSHLVKRTQQPAVSRPLFEPTLPKDRTDIRVCLFHRLKDGSLLTRVPGGFPFRHSLSGKGKSKILYEPYDVQVTCENFNSNESIGIAFKGPTPSLKHPEHDGFVAGSSRSSSSRYITWQAYTSVLKSSLSKFMHPKSKSPLRAVLAQYGKFLRTDPRAISRALAISLELGFLITIVSADENTNSYPSSNLLARSVMNQKLDTVAPAYLQYWSKLLAGNDYEYGYGGYVPPTTTDSVLFIGTSNNGSMNLLYTYPNSQSR
ncbi:hypothetical protein F5050DRAFT_1807065 [Lentinula boryana]|uniref:Uncharacterized protein n=1 Tax=Lentinula boryana TaxID=40481 RepID=A0ABQ8QFE1_9AGAR|nr:hypothetical protein F5050DRAFT_1807065 [Lentinula boryana]